jgi:hypothetical protein
VRPEILPTAPEDLDRGGDSMLERPTAKSGGARGFQGTARRKVFSNLLFSIGVSVGSNPTLSAKK